MATLFSEFPKPTAEDWVNLARQTAKAETLVMQFHDGIAVKAIYHDGPFPPRPGQFPYTRSTTADSQGWRVAQSLPYPDPVAVNSALLTDLFRGQDAVLVDLCTATRAGLETHHAPTTLCQDGTLVNHLGDLTALLRDIDLTAVPILVNTGASALPLGGMLRAYAAQQRFDLAALHGYVAADPLGHGVQTGLLPAPLPILEDQLALWTRWHLKNAPQLRTILCDGVPYREAGATLVQELGFVLATALHYLRALTLRGLTVDEVAGAIQFRLSIGGHLFSEISRLRAARQLWAKLVAACGGGESAQKLSLHAMTARFNKSRLDPHTNLLRTTTEAFAAAVGGAPFITVQPFDCLNGPPDEFSRRLARNTHAILAEEAQLSRLVDPLGGSWYGESLTEEIAAASWREVQLVEAQGGMGRALLKGTIQAQVDEKSRAALLQIFAGREGLVGVNRYPNASDRLSPSTHSSSLPASSPPRDEAAVKQALDALMVSNTVKNLSIASELGATVGELTASLSQGHGAAWTVLKPIRWAAAFEELRLNAQRYADQHGSPPPLLLLAMGKLSALKPRIDFAKNVLGVGGFQVTEQLVETPQEAMSVLQTAENPLKAVLLCAADADYGELVASLSPQCKANATRLMIAGAPNETLSQLGVELFLHAKANLLNMLDELQRQLEIVQ